MMRSLGVCRLVFCVAVWTAMPLALAATEVSPLEGAQGHDAGSLATGADTLEGGAPAVKLVVVSAEVSADISCQAPGPCLELATGLPLQVLPRPFSNLYRDAIADAAAIVQSNVPAFRPWVAFEIRGLDLSDPGSPKGWYRVGKSGRESLGWMRAEDVLEWRQALILSYTHPGAPGEGRDPVLMFKDQMALETLINAPDRAERAKAYYRKIEAREPPDDLLSIEPKRFVDITRNFYILPVLQHKTTDINGDEVRLLQLAAAVPGQRGADTIKDAGYQANAGVDRESAQGSRLEEVGVNLVFVIDTTRSMQPFIDMTRQAVINTTRSLDSKLKDRVRFGLVAYRDSTSVIPKLEYTTKNYTPSLVDAQTLIRLLDQEVKATEIGSLDYAEEMFAGVQLALDSAWEPKAMRFVLVIGDASSHPKGHPQNTSGFDAVDLVRMANDRQIRIGAMHLKDPRAADDHARASEQFGAIAHVRGAGEEAALVEIDTAREADFQAAADRMVARIGERLASAAVGRVAEAAASKPAVTVTASADPAKQAEMAMDRMWESALIEYIGRGAQPPKDIIAWVVDRDLVHPQDASLEVRVLITRTQLSSLVQALDQILTAFARAELTQGQFFDALQSVSGVTMKRPEDIGKAMQLKDSGLLPAFVRSLPYKSDILSLTEEMYASMTVDQRTQLQNNLLAKLKQYKAINEQVDAWRRLNEGDVDSGMIYPLHLDYLP